MRPPVKQPFKCNYCGDVGETLEEMRTHHAFLHSHLECNITNLMDEALSSLHSPSTSHSVEDTKQSSSIVRHVGSKSSPSVSTAASEVSKQTSDLEDLKSANESPSAVLAPQCKNTARKSFPSLTKRSVAVKSTSKAQVVEECDDNEEFSSYHMTQPPLELENVYSFVNLGAGVPMRLTVQQLGQLGLVNLKPQVVVTDVLDAEEN